MKIAERKEPIRRANIFVVARGQVHELPARRGRVAPLRSRPAIRKAIAAAHAPSAKVSVVAPEIEAWLISDREAFQDLLAEAMAAKVPRRKLGRLVFLNPPRLENVAAALDLFRSVGWTDDRQRWLPWLELIEVLNAPAPREYIVGGMVDPDSQTLTVYRGDFSRLTVPLSIFKPSGEGIAIDPADFEVIDTGHAVRLGKYQAAADAIFYEGDPDYRKEYRRRLRASEKTFGASLRRLRILRGLRQGDLGLPAKTVARIERGEVARPHGKTLALIAANLGVEPEEIETY